MSSGLAKDLVQSKILRLQTWLISWTKFIHWIPQKDLPLTRALCTHLFQRRHNLFFIIHNFWCSFSNKYFGNSPFWIKPDPISIWLLLIKTWLYKLEINQLNFTSSLKFSLISSSTRNSIYDIICFTSARHLIKRLYLCLHCLRNIHRFIERSNYLYPKALIKMFWCSLG